jgi:ribonuclease-3
LGHRFRRIRVLERALTHRSFAHEAGTPGHHYESLEFLGDSVLELIISESLYLANPDRSEGELSKTRSFLVSRSELADLSGRLGLGRYLRLSDNEEKTGGRSRKTILADAFESVIAAIYLDGGLEAARSFILNQFRDYLKQDARDELELGNYKSRLQERLHVLGGLEPSYRVIRESGPQHSKTFLIEVRGLNRVLARAQGTSKKRAEQKAARLALDELDLLKTAITNGKVPRRSRG